MIYVLTPEEMRRADAAAVARIGEDALMQNAGARIAETIRGMLPGGGRIVAFAGPGNNGGDAFAALALLDARYKRIVFAANATRTSHARQAAERRAREAGVAIQLLPERYDEARAPLEGAALAIDALFGTGARLPIAENYRAAIGALDARVRPVLAIDVPTGVDALTGAVARDCVRATATVALGALKPGLLLDPARERAGDLHCASIGIDDDELATFAHEFIALDDDALLHLLPVRSSTADKRGAGAPLVIAGSAQFPGAAVLCARAAARSGSGYVTVATPASVAATLRQHLVEQVVVALDESADPARVVAELLEISQRNDAIAIGPGLGLDARTGEIVRGLVAASDLPIVADAGALFHFTKSLESLRGKRIVVTPHAGEFARLSGEGTLAEGTRVRRIRAFVDRTGIATLLKGRDTLVYDGALVSINTTGTNALATAGSGDVLTGTIATLLAQGLSPYDAARAGAYWHGLAGARAAEFRRVGVTASDVIDALADALPV